MDIKIDRLIVADDEPLQRSGLSRIVKRLSPESEVIECSHGEEVIACLNRGPVDLVITDIRMPLLNGIDVAKFMALSHPTVKLIFVSAYQEFDYARTALEYGVSQYILKPYTVRAIQTMLEKMSALIAEERRIKTETAAFHEMRSRLEGDRTAKRLAEQCKVSLLLKRQPAAVDDFKLTDGRIACLELRRQSYDSGAEHQNKQAEALLIQTLGHELPGIAIYGLTHDQPRQDSSMFLVLIPGRIPHVQAFLSSALSSFDTRQKGSAAFISVSDYAEDLLLFSEAAYRQLAQTLQQAFYLNQSSVCDGSRYSDAFLDQFDFAFINLVRRLVKEGQVDQAVNLFRSQFSNHTVGFPEPFKVKQRFISILSKLMDEVKGMMTLSSYESLIVDTYSNVISCSSLEALFKVLSKRLAIISGHYASEPGSLCTVHDVLQYIRTNYAEEMSLQELSEKTNYSPSYLSSQIKLLTGLSYSNLIMSLRLDQACNLLTHSNAQIKEIASECGFRESSYFIRSFKSREGVTPEIYRKVRRKWLVQ